MTVTEQEIRNEQIKLRANAFNRLGVASATAAAIAPSAGHLYENGAAFVASVAMILSRLDRPPTGPRCIAWRTRNERNRRAGLRRPCRHHGADRALLVAVRPFDAWYGLVQPAGSADSVPGGAEWGVSLICNSQPQIGTTDTAPGM